MTNPLELLPRRTEIVFDSKGVGYKIVYDGDYDGEWINSLKKRAVNIGGTLRVQVENPQVLIDEETGVSLGANMSDRLIYLQHIILPQKEGYWVRQINGDRLDFRSANLEYMAPKEMMKYRGKRKRIPMIVKAKMPGSIYSTPYRGVSKAWNSKRDKHIAYWAVFRKKCIAYTTDTSDEGAIAMAEAYDIAAIEAYGDIAITNFPKEEYNGRV